MCTCTWLAHASYRLLVDRLVYGSQFAHTRLIYYPVYADLRDFVSQFL
jgi:hypothetical protein